MGISISIPSGLFKDHTISSAFLNASEVFLNLNEISQSFDLVDALKPLSIILSLLTTQFYDQLDYDKEFLILRIY